MLQWGHRKRGRFPSPKMIAVSRICWWEKCTCSNTLVAACPGNPSTVQFPSPPVSRSPSPPVPQRSGRPSCMPMVPHLGAWIPNAVSPPLPSHALSACVPPATRKPFYHLSPFTESDPSASPGTKVPLLSFFSRTHKYVKTFFNTNQFASLPFCSPHTKPHAVRGFSACVFCSPDQDGMPEL